MTQLHLIEQAKQGDPNAIAALMNKSLQPKGMTALVDRHDDRLEVTLEAERVPNRQALTAFVEKGISNLGIQIIKSVTVKGQQIGAQTPAWSHELQLETPVPEFEPELGTEATETAAERNQVPLATDRQEAERRTLHDFGSTQESEQGQDFNANQFHPNIGEAAIGGTEQRLTDLSQLQDLLSEEPEQPISEQQRQLLEEQIESIWQEQSAQSDNFLLDLMSGIPEEPNVQTEELLDAPLELEVQSEGLWLADQPSAMDAALETNLFHEAETHETETHETETVEDDFLVNLSADRPEAPFISDSEQSDPVAGFDLFGEEPPSSSFSLKQDEFVTQDQSANTFANENFEGFASSETETNLDSQDWNSQNWMNSAEFEEDEPDEILVGFMDSQPQRLPESFDNPEGTDDEPDEILTDFLPTSEELASNSTNGGFANGELNDLAELPSEDELINFFEGTEASPTVSAEGTFDTTPSDEPIELMGSLSEEFNSNFYEPVEVAPDVEALPDELGLLNQIEFDTDLDLAETNPAETNSAGTNSTGTNSTGTDRPKAWFEPQPDVSEQFLASDEFLTSDEFLAPATFETDEFTSTNEFGAEEFRNSSSELSFDDVSLTFGESLSDESGALTESPAESWDQPPIEFLQGEPDLSLPEMPTEQLDEPNLELSIEAIGSSPSGAQLEDFPPGFLQDSQESLEDLSEEFYVDPNENPFIEQMEENRDRPDEIPSNTPKSLDEEFGEFNQSDWQVPSANTETSYSSSDNPNDLPDLSAELSDLSLDPMESFDSSASANDFSFNNPSSDELSEEELINFFATDPPSEPTTASSDAISQLSETDLQPSDQYGQYREYGLEDYGISDEPYTSSSSLPTQPPEVLDTGEQDPDYQLSDALFLDSDYPESQPTDAQFPSEFSTAYSGSEFPESEFPESEFPPTEIPDPQLPDTQIPAREGVSQQALDAQMEDYDRGDRFEDDRIDSASIDPDRGDGTVVIPPDAEVDRTSESRGSPWLFPLILLGISGWIVGLISFAFLWSRLSSPPAQVQDDPSQPADVVDGAIPTADACTPPAEGGSPVALSNLQFQPNSENPQQVNLVGCVTNRTEQAIDIVSLGYRAGGGGAAVGGLNIPENLIQPGQTVVFTSRFTVPSDVSNVAIDSVFWQPAGTTTSEEAGTSIQVNR
jgi:hypothetical protein